MCYITPRAITEVTGSGKVDIFRKLTAGDTSGTYIVVLFYSNTCPACQAYLPKFNKWVERCSSYSSSSSADATSKGQPARFIYVSLSSSPDVFNAMGISKFPQTLFFNKGQELRDWRIVGNNPEELNARMTVVFGISGQSSGQSSGAVRSYRGCGSRNV